MRSCGSCVVCGAAVLSTLASFSSLLCGCGCRLQSAGPTVSTAALAYQL